MITSFLRVDLQLAAAILLLFSISGARAADSPTAKVDWAEMNPDISGATFVNSSSKCVECHEEYIRTFAMTKHGRSLPEGGCESCHGPMSKHLDAPRKKPALVVSFSKAAGLSPDHKSAICSQCHQSGIQLYWKMSAHAAADNTCVNCHDIMSMEDPVLVRTSQTKVCFTCHKDKRAQLYRRSRHPVLEGKVVCSDCHNPHGSAGPTQLKKNSVVETCYQCHAEKRGPFLNEHEPVRESCVNCHDPHGSTNPRMLKVREPFLCQQCHSEGYHPSTLYSGNDLPDPNDPSQVPAQQILGRSCTNCHVMIHGSNHPSGQRFTR
jgi:DmsE family decaheme c-type cytochrome